MVTLQIFAAFKCHPRPRFLHGDGWRLSGVYFLAYNHSFVINVYWKYRLAAAAFLPSASSFGNMCDDADIRLWRSINIYFAAGAACLCNVAAFSPIKSPAHKNTLDKAILLLHSSFYSANQWNIFLRLKKREFQRTACIGYYNSFFLQYKNEGDVKSPISRFSSCRLTFLHIQLLDTTLFSFVSI